MFTLLAFDLDGTLAHTESLTVADVIDCLNTDFGIPITEEHWWAHYHGMSGQLLMDKLNAEYGTNLVFETYLPIRNRRLPNLFANGVPPAPGVLQALRQLAAQGHQLCICSNSTPSRIALTLEKITGQHAHGLSLPKVFEGHIFSATTPGSPGQAKPAPDVYLAAAAHYGQNPASCLAVEDSVVGVQSAVAAGFTCWGYTGLTKHPAQEGPKMLAAGAARLFTHWDEFISLLSQQA